jgi:hypothetical protein
MIFPTRNEFDKWPLHTKWGFVSSLLAVAGAAASGIFFVLQPIGTLSEVADATSQLDRDYAEISSRSEHPTTKLEIPEYQPLSPVKFDNAGFDALMATFEQSRKEQKQYADKLMADAEAAANEKLRSACMFTEGMGRLPSTNLTVFFQRFNGIGVPKLGDDLALSLENKLVDWPAKFVDVKLHDGAAWVIFEAAENPCPQKGCPALAVTRAVARYAGIDEFVQTAKPGDYFKVQGVVQFMDADQNKDVPLIGRMVIDPMHTEYRTARIEGCSKF